MGAVTAFHLYGKTFNLEPPQGDHWARVALCESLYTYLLCFVVLNVPRGTGHNLLFHNDNKRPGVHHEL